jgi:hypothetical protein
MDTQTKRILSVAISFASVTLMSSAATNYVWQGSPHPGPPFGDWATAAHTIQEAVDGASPGDLILVTNGIYSSGGRAVYGLMTNRVAIDKAVTVQSVNGPEVTWLLGAQALAGGNGDGAIRCAYLGTNAVLSGFTLTNGHTRAIGGMANERSGGGAWCATNSVVTNCLFTSNSAMLNGGGAYYGTLDNCTLKDNSATANQGGGTCYGTLNNCKLIRNSAPGGGGAYSSMLNNCALIDNAASSDGGGALRSRLRNCTLTRNSAGNMGGGAGWCTLDNCMLAGNSATYGGGAYSSTLNNCSLAGNRAYWGGGVAFGTNNNCTLISNTATNTGGGAYAGTLNNCILYYNTSTNCPNSDPTAMLNYCCTTPMPSTGVGNITNEPAFVDLTGGELRLQSNSPCRNAGTNATAQGPADLDGRPRIAEAAVDMGAYEFQPDASGVFIAWLQRFGLPTDGSADLADADGDHLNNWQEWVADINPTNALSFFRLAIGTTNASSAVIACASSSARLYTLLRCTDIANPNWVPVLGQSDIPGTSGPLALIDPDPPPTAFYRVSVRLP